MDKTKAGAIGGALFLIGLGILFLTGWWWPGIIVVIGISSAITSLIAGEIKHALGSVIFFGIILILALTDVHFMVIIPLLIIGLGIWILIQTIKK